MSKLTVGQLVQDAQMEVVMHPRCPHNVGPGTDSWDFEVRKVGYVPKEVTIKRELQNEVLFIKCPAKRFQNPFRNSFWINTRTGQVYPYETSFVRFTHWLTKQLGAKTKN